MHETSSRNTPPRRNKFVIIVLLAFVLIFASLSVFLSLRSGIFSLLLVKLGLQEDVPVNKDPYKAWANCLNQLDIDADIVFIGDSITANGNFQSLIPNKTVCNLGCYGDQIWDVTARINAVKTVTPEEIYIMIGTNTLACRTLEQAMRSYSFMADTYISSLPDCKITFISILPVTAQLENGARTNTNIQIFNTFIRSTAEKLNSSYVDLFHLYVFDGALNPDYTNDGLHITKDSYSIWANAIRNDN